MIGRLLCWLGCHQQRVVYIRGGVFVRRCKRKGCGYW